MVDAIKHTAQQLSAGSLPGGKAPRASRPAMAEHTSPAPQVDSSQLGSKAAISNMAKTPPIDLEAVGRIKEAIAQGKYPVNLDRVTDKLMESFAELSG